jgi:hypothetical protein
MSPTRKAAKKAVRKAAKKATKKAARKATKPAKKAAARKPAAKKPAAKKPAARKPAAKKAAAKQPAAKKAAAKKPAARKPVAKKAPAKKPAPSKAPVKKTAAPAARKPAPKQPAAAKKPAAAQPRYGLTGESVDAHIAAISDPGRRQDCRTLVEVFSKATGKQPKMWGPSIVAFGKYHYKYASGHEGDSCLAGFASRKGALTLYLTPEPHPDRDSLLRRLGKHQEGKGCVYVKNLDGIDLEVLGELVKQSAELTLAKYPNEA